MTTEQQSPRPQKAGIRLTNKTLLIMIGALSAVLVLLLIVGITLPTGTPQGTNPPVLDSQGTATTTPTTEATTAPTTEATTAPTTEATTPSTEETK